MEKEVNKLIDLIIKKVPGERDVAEIMLQLGKTVSAVSNEKTL